MFLVSAALGTFPWWKISSQLLFLSHARQMPLTIDPEHGNVIYLESHARASKDVRCQEQAEKSCFFNGVVPSGLRFAPDLVDPLPGC